MKKAIFTECAMDMWIDIAKTLKEKNKWEILYWTSKETFEKKVKNNFPKTIFHANIDAVRGVPAEEFKELNLPALDQELLKDFAFCESISLNMMNRMDVDDSFSYPDRLRLYHTLLKYWIAVLDNLKPDIVVGPVSPHLIYDYILYCLCKRKKIKTFMFRETAFDHLIFPVEEFEKGSIEIQNVYKEYIKKEKYKDKKISLSENTEKYLNNMSKKYSDAAPSYMKGHYNKENYPAWLFNKYKGYLYEPSEMFIKIRNYEHPGRYLFTKKHHFKEKGKNIEDSDVRGLKLVLAKRKGHKKKKYLRKYYDNLTEEPDLKSPYIYVSLHYQPERTSCPEGEIFTNQFLMVEMLSKLAPNGWKVYVKEHPTQLMKHGAGERSRDTNFYDDIISLDNVSFVPINSSQFDLVDNSKAVATITGTSGWEGVLRGKPSLVFGHAWYKECEGVFYISTIKKCKKVLDKIKAGYKIDKNLVRLYLHVLEKVSTKGYVNPIFVKTSGISYKENVKNLADTINSFIN